MLALFFLGLACWRLRGTKISPAGEIQKNGSAWTSAWREVPRWIFLAAFFEAVVLVLQLLAVQFAVAAIVISIKRSGILLACVVGWFVFHERDITDRVIGSFVMVAGVAVFFLTKPNAQGEAIIGFNGALGVAALALAGLSLALYLTRHWNKSVVVGVAGQNLSRSKA